VRTPILVVLLSLALAGPLQAQTPPPETVDFESVSGTPIPFESLVKLPKSARIKQVRLQGGGLLRFRTRGGAKYAALVTVQGTTAIVGVNKKGKVQPRKLLDIRLRKAKTARLDAFTPVNAGVRIDDKGTSDPSDDEIFYDGPGVASFRLRDSKKNLFPVGGGLFRVSRTSPSPFDLTTTSLDFVRIEIASDGTRDEDSAGNPAVVQHMVYDDIVVSYGH
jgi:hypothetical protein